MGKGKLESWEERNVGLDRRGAEGKLGKGEGFAYEYCRM